MDDTNSNPETAKSAEHSYDDTSTSKDKKSAKSSERKQERTKTDNTSRPAVFFQKPQKETIKSEDEGQKTTLEPWQKPTLKDTGERSDKVQPAASDGRDGPKQTHEYEHSTSTGLDESNDEHDEHEHIGENEEISTQSEVNTSDEILDTEPKLDETLTEEEAHEAVNALIDARSSELKSELHAAESESIEEYEAIADVLFLENLRERADSEEPFSEASIQESFADAVEELDQFEEVSEHEPSQFNSDEDETIKAEGSDLEDETAPVVPPPISPPSPPIGGGRGSGLPPRGPRMPAWSASPSPRVSELMSAREFEREVDYEVARRRRKGRDVLVGAVLGYVIGRRGGRKRTEKRLIPKLDKLEKQVGELHDVITEKEAQIRLLARKQAQARPELLPVLATKAVEKRALRAEVKMSKERKRILAEKPSVETLGSFNLSVLEVFRERRMIDGTENSPKRKPVETMTVDELLEKAEGIVVDGEPIIQAFQQGRIRESELREVTKRFLRKGDYVNYYRREVQAHPEELQKKRQTLDRLHQSRTTTAPLPVSAILPTMIGKNNYREGSEKEQTAIDTKASTKPASVKPRRQLPAPPQIPLPWVVGVTASVTLAVLLLLNA